MAQPFDRCVERLTACGIEMRPDRLRMAGEGRSAYFYDYDTTCLNCMSARSRNGSPGIEAIDCAIAQPFR